MTRLATTNAARAMPVAATVATDRGRLTSMRFRIGCPLSLWMVTSDRFAPRAWTVQVLWSDFTKNGNPSAITSNVNVSFSASKCRIGSCVIVGT